MWKTLKDRISQRPRVGGEGEKMKRRVREKISRLVRGRGSSGG